MKLSTRDLLMMFAKNPTGTSLLGSTPSTTSPPLSNYLGGLSGLYRPPDPPQWPYVRSRFTKFLSNLILTPEQLQDGITKQAGIRSCLNRYYYNDRSDTANSMLIGSWGKLLRVRPPRDIDILFLLPPEVYWRYQERAGNKQSQLLQEVKGVLSQTYSQTVMRGDGQVVVVPFTSMPVEVSIGFRCQDGSIITCDTNEGGKYATSSAEAEIADLVASDSASNGNTRALIRMMKQWQREKNVPLKSFLLERLAIEFMSTWGSRLQDVFYHDWMIRDFLVYIYNRANGYITMPGTGKTVALGNEWQSRALTAYKYAASACDNEKWGWNYLAGSDWQNIFGTTIPMEA